MRSTAWLLLVAMLAFAVPAHADEPIMTVAKNTLIGAATGLVLGGTLCLVLDEDSRDDSVRWGVVLGAFGGFALGVALAAHGDDSIFSQADYVPSQAALRELEHDRRIPPISPDGWSVRLPLLTFSW